MKVVFNEDVRGQGKKGEIKEVSDGYARNYLLPRKLASVATPDAINAIKLKEKAKAAQAAKERHLRRSMRRSWKPCRLRYVPNPAAAESCSALSLPKPSVRR